MSYQQNPYARPGAPRTSSSNYAAAQALYAAKKYSSSSSTSSIDTAQLPIRTANPVTEGAVTDGDVGKDDMKAIGEGRRVVGDVNACAGWTPRYVQVQSWNEQDMKREFQMARLAEGTGPGFSEGK